MPWIPYETRGIVIEPRQGGQMDAAELEIWAKPDFVEYETPMEVTAYAARMED